LCQIPLIWTAYYSFLILGGSDLAKHMNAKVGPSQGPSGEVAETNCFASALKKSNAELKRPRAGLSVFY
jgi:hypothetical protein